MTRSEAAEVARKLFRYRQMILQGKLSLPHEAAVRLVGPDCAYQLYGHIQSATSLAGSSPEGPGEGRLPSKSRC